MLFPLILVVLVGGYTWRHLRSSRSKPIAATTIKTGPLRTGWPLVDDLWKLRGHYQKDLQLEELPGWSSYTREYFLRLAARREAIQVWALDQPTKPQIHFMGQWHVNLAGGNTPESIREVERVQTILFERVQAQTRDVSVVAIEEQGTDERLTPEIFFRLTRDSFHLLGVQASDEELWRIMREDRQVSTRAIMELKTPVICGEEWPLRLESSVLVRPAPPMGTDARMAYDHFMGIFRALRSEIILIRSLEYMRRNGGSRAIIVQGEGHREDLERLAPEYHVALTTEFPQ